MKSSAQNLSCGSQTSYKSEESQDLLEELQTLKVISVSSTPSSRLCDINNSRDHYRSEDFVFSMRFEKSSVVKENFYEISLSFCNEKGRCVIL